MIKSVTKEEARQALKTIAQYCDDIDCYECEIQDACEGIKDELFPFCGLSVILDKKRKRTQQTQQIGYSYGIADYEQERLVQNHEKIVRS